MGGLNNIKFKLLLVTFQLVVVVIGGVRGQNVINSSTPCYGGGSIATAVLVTFFGTILLIGAGLYYLKRRADTKDENHLILETDPENGGADYAFDNPAFKDNTEATKSTSTKWGQWPLFIKNERKRPQDDSAITNDEIKVVSLKSQDFTGLGFNICGNMKEGIYIKDILHRGPANESKKLYPGDRICSVTISYEHMVLEDAANILSYASPYEVTLEAKGPKTTTGLNQSNSMNIMHPIYRSASLMDSKQSSNYSSLQNKSNVTTLERPSRMDSIRRDPITGIPLEVPEHMEQVAMVAKRNRRNDKTFAKAFEDLRSLDRNDSLMENVDDKSRSTGDLQTVWKQPELLERAKSLDITDHFLIRHEPRLSLVLNGLTTIQKAELKKSTEWGNLEDAILERQHPSEPEFSALCDRANQIKEISPEVLEMYQQAIDTTSVVNKIWPDEEEIKRPQRPVAPERTKLKINSTQEVNLNEKITKVSPISLFEKHQITETCSQIARRGDMIQDEWEMKGNDKTEEVIIDTNEILLDGTNQELEEIKRVIDNFIEEERKTFHHHHHHHEGQKFHSLELNINATPDVEDTVTVSCTSLPIEQYHHVEIMENNYSTLEPTIKLLDEESPAISLDNYVTEIQVTDPKIEEAFESYVKQFETDKEKVPQLLHEKLDHDREEVAKIEEIAEEQLKTLPEMKFTTSTYEEIVKPPEKRHSFEQIRLNFEKPSTRRDSTKSRIPISTTPVMKTPPMSPERRDSATDMDRTMILDFTSKIKPPNYNRNNNNVSITSIKNGGGSTTTRLSSSSNGKPPIPPPKKDDQMVESSFKQWVFSPSPNVTNVPIIGKDK